MEQARSELLLKLGKDAKIMSEKVLHERMENGKVKMNIIFTVEENIARVQPIK